MNPFIPVDSTTVSMKSYENHPITLKYKRSISRSFLRFNPLLLNIKDPKLIHNFREIDLLLYRINVEKGILKDFSDPQMKYDIVTYLKKDVISAQKTCSQIGNNIYEYLNICAILKDRYQPIGEITNSIRHIKEFSPYIYELIGRQCVSKYRQIYSFDENTYSIIMKTLSMLPFSLSNFRIHIGGLLYRYVGVDGVYCWLFSLSRSQRDYQINDIYACHTNPKWKKYFMEIWNGKFSQFNQISDIVVKEISETSRYEGISGFENSNSKSYIFLKENHTFDDFLDHVEHFARIMKHKKLNFN